MSGHTDALKFTLDGGLDGGDSGSSSADDLQGAGMRLVDGRGGEGRAHGESSESEVSETHVDCW